MKDADDVFDLASLAVAHDEANAFCFQLFVSLIDVINVKANRARARALRWIAFRWWSGNATSVQGQRRATRGELGPVRRFKLQRNSQFVAIKLH